MRLRLMIALTCAASACGDAEPPAESAAVEPQSSPPHARPTGVADLVIAEAEILARAGMGFQRRWLDWHFAGHPTNDNPFGRADGVAGYEATGFDPASLSDADRAALDRARAAIAALPRAELHARYRALVARHGNAPPDASPTGSLRITDDGHHLVFADGDDPDIAYAWRIADGARVGRVAMFVSEDPFWTRDALPSGLVWTQWTPTPAGRRVGVWDLTTGQKRWSQLVGDEEVLAVSNDGQRVAIASARGVVVRAAPRLRPVASVRGVSSASVVRRITGKDDVIGEYVETSVAGRAAFSGDGKFLALLAVAGGGTARLRLFRVAGGAPVRDLAVSLGDLSHLAVDRAGRRVVGYAAARHAFAVWDGEGERVVEAGAPIDEVALSADGALALVSRGTRLELLDLATGAARWTVELAAPARAVALSAPAGLVAWWSDRELAVADLATGDRRPSFAGHTTWPDPATHREALALATVLEDPAPPMFEAAFRDPLDEADALDAELSPAYLAWLPRAQLALLPDLVEAHRGKPVRGPAAAIVRAWREGCDGWYGKEDPDYAPEKLEPVDRRNLDAIHREIARRGAASPEAVPAGVAIPPRPCGAE